MFLARACNRCKLGRGMWHSCDFCLTAWLFDFLLGNRDEIVSFTIFYVYRWNCLQQFFLSLLIPRCCNAFSTFSGWSLNFLQWFHSQQEDAELQRALMESVTTQEDTWHRHTQLRMCEKNISCPSRLFRTWGCDHSWGQKGLKLRVFGYLKPVAVAFANFSLAIYELYWNYNKLYTHMSIGIW